MSFIVGRKVTLEEQLKQNQQLIKDAVKIIDKELFQIQFESKQLEGKIKQCAKQKQQDGVMRIYAKQIVRNQAAFKRFLTQKANIAQSMQAMASVMYSAGHILNKINLQMNLPELSKMMSNFNKESQKFQEKQEMLDEMLDEAFEVEDEDDQTEDKINEVISSVLEQQAPGPHFSYPEPQGNQNQYKNDNQ